MQCFVCFTSGPGHGRLGGHTALAGCDSLQAMPVAPAPLFAKYTFRSSIAPFCIQGRLRKLQKPL